MTTTDRDLHTIEAIYQTATERALCIRETEDGPDVWLPRSEATINLASSPGALFGDAPPSRGEAVRITAPEWLLTDKGLL